jgi:hypothetical protein
MYSRRITLALIALAAVAAMPAQATPQSDFNEVYGDWKADLVIAPCRWTRAQLQNAYDVSNGNPDFQYETKFQDDTLAEIKRWDSRGCSGVAPISARRKSPLFGVRVVKVTGKGALRREVVRIRNGSKKTIAFRKASMRNLKGGRSGKAVFPAKFKLAKGRTAVVRIGCAKGKRRASFKGRNVWLCRKKQLFRDKGDVARLADAKGVVVSQRGYGSQKRRVVF